MTSILSLAALSLPARIRPASPVGACLAATCLLLGGCSPALDWRDARLGGPVRLLMPCKPDRIERQLTLAGRPAQALMLVCDAEGVTWSATRYELGEPAQVGPALRELRVKLGRNLGAQPAADHAPLDATLPAGLARLPEAGRLHLAGHRPSGEAIQAQALFFGEGGRAYQLVALLPGVAGKPLLAGAGQFLDGVQLAR
jgi:hypothetical protein